jgi:thiamine-monophosphate kinase
VSTAHTALGPGREFDAVRATLARLGETSRGVGDDAAVVEFPAGQRLVLSTDTSVENVHFRRDWLTAEEIAYRACAAAISDLAAMGAAPLAMTTAFTLPADWRGQTMALADGTAQISRVTGMPIVGGDVSDGVVLAIAVTVVGSVDPTRVLARSGAREGDTLFVTGRLGGPLLALKAFERGMKPSPHHRERFAHPSPRLREGQWLAMHGATAAIDISDGVVVDAAHIAAASRTCVEIDLDALPTIGGATTDDAARSGEEYELLVAGPASLDTAAFEREFNLPLTPIGRITPAGPDGPRVSARDHGIEVPAPNGHDHFSA